jgi:hypothetical protein
VDAEKQARPQAEQPCYQAQTVSVVVLLLRQTVAVAAVARHRSARTQSQAQAERAEREHRSTPLLAAGRCLRAVAVEAVDKLLAVLAVLLLVVQVARQTELQLLQTRQAVAVEQTTQARAPTVVQESFTFDGRFKKWHTLHKWLAEAFTQ